MITRYDWDGKVVSALWWKGSEAAYRHYREHGEYFIHLPSPKSQFAVGFNATMRRILTNPWILGPYAR